MAEVLVSPGISITETDRSAYAARPLVAGAALLGPTVKGQPNIPTRVTSYGDFTRRFGAVFELESGSTKVQQEFLTSIAAKSYFEQGGDSLLVVRVAPEGYFKGANSTRVKSLAEESAEQDLAVAQIEASKAQAAVDQQQARIDSASAALAEVGDDPEAHAAAQEALDRETAALEPLNSAKAEADEVVEKAKQSVDSVATDTSMVPFVLKTLSCGAMLNSVAGEEYKSYGEEDADERKDGSLVLGSSDNLRFEISSVDPETGTFALVIRRGNDVTKDKAVLESYSNLSLDPNSVNYIAKVIGDQHAAIAFDDDGLPYVDIQGNYTNKSAYVYVADVHNTLNYLCTDGETVNTDATGRSFRDYLPQEQSGGFYGAAGIVGKYTGDKDVDADYYEDIRKNSEYPQAVKPSDYDIAISLLENVDEYDINIVSAPGVLNADTVSKVVALAESRGDCIAVVDLSDCDDSTKQAAEDAQSQNSSYAATYYPWLQMYNSVGRLVWCPASVVIPGVYVYNDKQAAPWYAPAGMLRGGVQGVVQTRKKLTKAHRDTLYKKNVNPIGTFPGSGIVIYGQKTLQKKTSALDRVNARRLLIELKKAVKEMASRLLFEHNTPSVRNSFRARLEPYLESVVQRNGLYAYKVVIDELNDADTIDRNEFRCQIYVQPSKVIEFIYLDFTITATGVEFND